MSVIVIPKILEMIQLWILLLITIINFQCFEGIKLVRFAGGGIYFWWQAGAAQYLLENCDLQKVNVIGSSAGSLAATLLACDISFQDAAKVAIRLANEQQVWDRKSGLQGIWGPMIKQFLEELLPNDLNETILNKISIYITPINIMKGAKIVTKFTNKYDLIDALMASVHIPLFMNGKIYSYYKNEKYIDGSFWSFVRKKTLPLPMKEFAYIDSDNDILCIDHNYDIKFINSLQDKSIVKLITPDGLYEMMNYGYQYMDNIHKQGKLNTISDNIKILKTSS